MALGRIGGGAKDAVPALIQALKDQHEEVRNNAAWTLGRIGKDAVPALIQALKDQNIEVRQYAAGALGRIAAVDAVSALMQA